MSPASVKVEAKIAVYGFGSMPIIWRHLYEISQAENIKIGWCVILPTPDWRDLVHGILPDNDVLDVYRELPRSTSSDFSCLADYAGSLAEDIDADKRPNRWLKGHFRLMRAVEYYKLYKSFLRDSKATHVLLPTIESSDAKIATAIAEELGIGVLALADMRSLTGTFFAADAYETPPRYAAVTDEYRAEAKRFIERYRRSPAPARSAPIELAANDDAKLRNFAPLMPSRSVRFFRRAFERPDLFSLDTLRVSAMRNLPLLRQAIRGVRTRLNARQYDIATVEQLPTNFIYYPIQYSPEASINTPAPYFLDQLRAIDALRYAMPNNFLLVVKEHWACIPVRPVDYIRQIRRLPGVVVARYDLPSIDLIRRAKITATVTGTAALEAALLGHPALLLGRFLPAHISQYASSLDTLRADVRRALEDGVSEEALVDSVAKLLSVRYPFYYGSVGEPGEPVLRTGNMRRFLFSLFDHIERERAVPKLEMQFR